MKIPSPEEFKATMEPDTKTVGELCAHVLEWMQSDPHFERSSGYDVRDFQEPVIRAVVAGFRSAGWIGTYWARKTDYQGTYSLLRVYRERQKGISY